LRALGLVISGYLPQKAGKESMGRAATQLSKGRGLRAVGGAPPRPILDPYAPRLIMRAK